MESPRHSTSPTGLRSNPSTRPSPPRNTPSANRPRQTPVRGQQPSPCPQRRRGPPEDPQRYAGRHGAVSPQGPGAGRNRGQRHGGGEVHVTAQRVPLPAGEGHRFRAWALPRARGDPDPFASSTPLGGVARPACHSPGLVSRGGARSKPMPWPRRASVAAWALQGGQVTHTAALAPALWVSRRDRLQGHPGVPQWARPPPQPHGFPLLAHFAR